MPFYSCPGVYIVEEAGPKVITPIGANTPLFLGQAPDPKVPWRAINNWSEFRTYFAPGDYTSATGPNHLANAVNGFFNNQGSRCYVVHVNDNEPLTNGLKLMDANDEISMMAAPGRFDPPSHEALAACCERRGDAIAILDTPNITDIELLKTVESPSTSPKTTKPKDAAGGSGPADKPPDACRPRTSLKGFSALYWPWIRVTDALSQKEGVECPPSGYLAGIWASVPVHKAPANINIQGATEPVYRVTPSEQAVLNPLGINCIRWFSKQGMLVWGARTLADESSEWRYINVRRLFIMMEQSILRQTSFAVFEPNDRLLWKTVKSVVTAFLMNIWRDGALMGRTPDEAFFVKCDEEVNPQESIDLGQLNVVVGAAPVKPAEFIIFKIAQTHEGAKIETL